MRPQARIDMGYVPTPGAVVDAVRAMLRFDDGDGGGSSGGGAACMALDPCAGDGAALARLAPEGSLYGIELDPDRASSALSRLDHVLIGDGTTCRVSHESFGLLLLNPPYDDSTSGRLERVFLERCEPYLAIGGVLVFIIGAGRFGNVHGLLRRRFDVVGHWRFPDGLYDDYGQTVLVATRRRPGSGRAERSERGAEAFWCEDLRLPAEYYGCTSGRIPAELMEPLPDVAGAGELPKVDVPATSAPRLFTTALPEPEVMARLVSTSPVSRKMRLPPQIACGRPPLPLRQGHISLTLASGLVNGVYGEGAERHVAKGIVTRTVKREVTEAESSRGDERMVIETTIEGFAISIRVLTAAGALHTIGGDNGKDA